MKKYRVRDLKPAHQLEQYLILYPNNLGVYVQFLKDTCVFYKKAIENLQKKHSFTLQEVLGSEMSYSSKEHRAQVLAG